jgi:hypothetical protein
LPLTEEEIAQIIKEDSVPKKNQQKKKQAAKYGLKIFQGKILNFTCFYLEKTGFVATRAHAEPCLRFKLCKQTIYI